MKCGDIFRGYNWNFLVAIIAIFCLGFSYFFPFSNFGFLLVASGGIGLMYLFLNLIFKRKGGEKDG